MYICIYTINVLGVLDDLLLGTPSAALRKALTESQVYGVLYYVV